MPNIEQDQFWTMELDADPNVADLLHNVAVTLRYEHTEKPDPTPRLLGLVDEASGGIIAYVIHGNEESLLAHLGMEEVVLPNA